MTKHYTLRVEGKELTKDDLKAMFDEYNKLYFWGKLGKCEFFWVYRNDGCLGKYQEKKGENNKIISRIGLWKTFEWTDARLKTVLVHEMIHMYLRRVEHIRFDGLFNHGLHFRSHIRRIKRDYGVYVNIASYNLDENQRISFKYILKEILYML